jgi:hypothetical protein
VTPHRAAAHCLSGGSLAVRRFGFFETSRGTCCERKIRGHPVRRMPRRGEPKATQFVEVLAENNDPGRRGPDEPTHAWQRPCERPGWQRRPCNEFSAHAASASQRANDVTPLRRKRTPAVRSTTAGDAPTARPGATSCEGGLGALCTPVSKRSLMP